MNFLSRLLRCLRAVPLTVALLVPLSVSAFSTANLVSGSLSALSSCLHYQVKGVCFFLYCSWTGCRIRTSIRVSHYLPEVVVSTYQHPDQHPWADWGKTVSGFGWKLGESIMGSTIDSQGEIHPDHHYNKTSLVTYKSADAYGNPAASITNMTGGNMSVSSISWPGTSELSGWESSYNSSNRGGAGGSGSGIGQNLFGEIFGSGNVNISSSIGSIIRSEGPSLQQMGLSGQGQGQGQGQGGQGSSSSGGRDDFSIRDYIGTGYDYICPGASQLLMPHFISEIDALVWRDKVPLELLYPSSYIPGLNEVSINPLPFPLNHTWGNVFPRTGSLVQQHPVKASAVLAERVRSIITQKRQPHVYTAITRPSGYTYFPRGSWPAGANVRWQMMHPKVSKSCVQFGTNDSLGAGAFGDGLTSETNAYSWNMWMQHDCCKNKGAFLFSIP